jgi:L-alanine-DL-glutamate epimerase-like enolase superfamily enzyme
MKENLVMVALGWLAEANRSVPQFVPRDRRMFGLPMSSGCEPSHAAAPLSVNATALHAPVAIPPSPHTANPVALQNEPVVEFDRTHNPLRDELLSEKFVLKEGALPVPQRPGLGIRVDETVLGKYSANHSAAR